MPMRGSFSPDTPDRSENGLASVSSWPSADAGGYRKVVARLDL